jgi:hypothetical protein
MCFFVHLEWTPCPGAASRSGGTRRALNPFHVRRIFMENFLSLREELELALEGLESRKKPEEALLVEARVLMREWKGGDGRPLYGCYEGNDRLVLLFGLVALQRREARLLEGDSETLRAIGRHFSWDLKALRVEALMADLLAAQGVTSRPKRGRREKYERTKRRRGSRNYRNSIEYQFGGEGEEAWKKCYPLWGSKMFGAYAPAYQPVCLDEVFKGHPLNMVGLEELFNMERHRLYRLFPEKPPLFDGGPYDYRVVFRIVPRLLKEKQKRRGARKRLWLSGPSLRVRVLRGMEARLMSLERVPGEITKAFQFHIGPHLQ